MANDCPGILVEIVNDVGPKDSHTPCTDNLLVAVPPWSWVCLSIGVYFGVTFGVDVIERVWVYMTGIELSRRLGVGPGKALCSLTK